MHFTHQKPSFRPERSAVEVTYPRRNTARTFLAAILLYTTLLLIPTPTHAQGCTQCLDNTAATPPKTQAAYRHAILLLTLTAGGLFVTTLALFKRHR